MNKKEMISYLVREWVKSAKDKETRELRFIKHDEVENKLNKNWTKEGIKWAYDLYTCEGYDIEDIITKFYDLRG